MIEIGTITIQLDNVSEADTMRLKESVHTLIANGTLNIRGGKAILHFDGDGRLMKVDHDFCKWIRKKQ